MTYLFGAIGILFALFILRVVLGLIRRRNNPLSGIPEITVYKVSLSAEPDADVYIVKAFDKLGVGSCGMMNAFLKKYAWTDVNGPQYLHTVGMMYEKRSSPYFGDWITERGGLTQALFETDTMTQERLDRARRIIKEEESNDLAVNELHDKIREGLRGEFSPKYVGSLRDKLVELIQSGTKTLLNDDTPIKALTVEYDQVFDFRYVAYPTPQTLEKDYNFNNYEINVSDPRNDEIAEDIFKKCGLEELEIWTWVKAGTEEEIEIQELQLEVEQEIFTQAWQEAKALTGSDIRCFFLEHDIYTGVDADTGSAITDDQIQRLFENDLLFDQ